MFLIMGISDGSKQLGFDQMIICGSCGQYGHIQIWVTYTYFMFFFIPLFKWNRHYYVKMSCCGAQCELDPSLGREIERGRITQLDETQLHFGGNSDRGYNGGTYEKRCPNCGYAAQADFEYCPKCGTRL